MEPPVGQAAGGGRPPARTSTPPVPMTQQQSTSYSTFANDNLAFSTPAAFVSSRPFPSSSGGSASGFAPADTAASWPESSTSTHSFNTHQSWPIASASTPAFSTFAAEGFYPDPYSRRNALASSTSSASSAGSQPGWAYEAFPPSSEFSGRYLSYYDPMTDDTSSSESYLYSSSDDSHLRSHTQQSSEDSSVLGGSSFGFPHPSTSQNPFLAPSGALQTPPHIATSYFNQAQAVPPGSLKSGIYTPLLDATRGLALDNNELHQTYTPQHELSDGGLTQASESRHQHLAHQEASFGQWSGATPGTAAGASPQVALSHGSDSLAPASTGEASVLNSPFSGACSTAEGPGDSSDAAMQRREDSSFSSEASSAVDSDPLLKQEMHADGRPRRPLNAFMIFSRHRRPTLQRERPELKVREIAQELAQEWRSLDQEGKAEFLGKAKIVKESFHRNHPDYVYSRRPNGARNRRKGKGSLSNTPSKTVSTKSNLKRLGRAGAAESDDNLLSPGGYASSSASSTTSFALAPMEPTIYMGIGARLRRQPTSLSQSSQPGEGSANVSDSDFVAQYAAAPHPAHRSPAMPHPHEMAHEMQNLPIQHYSGPLLDPVVADLMAPDSSASSVSPYSVSQPADWASSATSSTFTNGYHLSSQHGHFPPYSSSSAPPASWPNPWFPPHDAHQTASSSLNPAADLTASTSGLMESRLSRPVHPRRKPPSTGVTRAAMRRGAMSSASSDEAGLTFHTSRPPTPTTAPGIFDSGRYQGSMHPTTRLFPAFPQGPSYGQAWTPHVKTYPHALGNVQQPPLLAPVPRPHTVPSVIQSQWSDSLSSGERATHASDSTMHSTERPRHLVQTRVSSTNGTEARQANVSTGIRLPSINSFDFGPAAGSRWSNPSSADPQAAQQQLNE